MRAPSPVFVNAEVGLCVLRGSAQILKVIWCEHGYVHALDRYDRRELSQPFGTVFWQALSSVFQRQKVSQGFRFRAGECFRPPQYQ